MENTENIKQDDPAPVEIQSKNKSWKYRKLKFIVPILIVAIMFTAICGIVWAKKKFHDGPEGFIIERLTENLNLNAGQKAQVDKIKDEIKQKMEANKPDHEGMMNEFANEFKKDNLDKNTLKQLAQTRDQKREEMKDFMMDKLIEFHNILTAEQRNKVVENMKDMKNMFHGFHEGDKSKDKDRKDSKD